MADHGTARKRHETEDVLQQVRGELQRLLDETERHTGVVKIDPNRGTSFREEVDKFQRDLLIHALRLANGKQKEAARLLHLSPSTLNVKLKALGIDPKAV